MTAGSLTGRWRIVHMDAWDLDDVDLVAPGSIEFAGDGHGSFSFITVRGWMDCRNTERNGRTCVEFTWEGIDEEDQVSGRGWAALVDDATLEGCLFIHLGDESGFRAERFVEAEDGR